MRPKWLTAASATFEAVSFMPMSPSTRTRSAEGFSSCDLLTVRELPTTRKPRWSSARVMPNPRPLDAPVTIATCCWPAFVLMAFVSSFSLPPNCHERIVGRRGSTCPQMTKAEDFNLFTRRFLKPFRKECTDLLGMRAVANPKVKFGRETHASTTQSDPLLLPTRNGPCREDGALHWGYLSCRVQHPPP